MKFLKIKNKNKIIIVLGLLLLFGSLFLLINKYLNQEQLNKVEERAIEVFFEEKQEIEEPVETKKEETEEAVINYIAVLEIPKINLKRGLVSITDPLNNVNKNVQILDETVFPNGDNKSHVILAGHSGTGRNAYFRNLHKLDMKDKIYFYYKNIKYTYEVSNIYEVKKTGEVNLRLTYGSDISLITCISGTNKQVVHIANLIEKEKY